MSQFAIAGLQLALIDGDNLNAMLKEIRLVKTRFPWVDMVVLSELATFGANPANALPPGNDAEQNYQSLASELGIYLVPGSMFERTGDIVTNMAPVIGPDGKIIARYRKMFPFCPYESGVTAGSEFVVFDVPEVGRFGVSICYDKWFPETTRTLASLGAEVIIHPTLTTTLDRDVEIALTRANAASNQCYFFDINTAAPFGFGRSTIAGPGGEVLHQASSTSEVMPVEIDLDYVRRVRRRGWNGLCQTLKSFRDTGVSFPVYAPGGKGEYLDTLGELTTPKGVIES